MSNAFSQIVAVLMRDPNFRNLRLADLEWLVLPSVVLGQFSLAHAKQQTEPIQPGGTEGGAMLVPVGLALWAYVSPGVHEQLSNDPNRQIRASEWASGKIPWLIAVAGTTAALPSFLRQLQSSEFKGKTVTMRVRNAESATMTVTLSDFLARQAEKPPAAEGKS